MGIIKVLFDMVVVGILLINKCLVLNKDIIRNSFPIGVEMIADR